MKKLKSKLNELTKQGYETVTIIQILQFISDIERENSLKKIPKHLR